MLRRCCVGCDVEYKRITISYMEYTVEITNAVCTIPDHDITVSHVIPGRSSACLCHQGCWCISDPAGFEMSFLDMSLLKDCFHYQKYRCISNVEGPVWKQSTNQGQFISTGVPQTPLKSINLRIESLEVRVRAEVQPICSKYSLLWNMNKLIKTQNFVDSHVLTDSTRETFTYGHGDRS